METVGNEATDFLTDVRDGEMDKYLFKKTINFWKTLRSHPLPELSVAMMC